MADNEHTAPATEDGTPPSIESRLELATRATYELEALIPRLAASLENDGHVLGSGEIAVRKLLVNRVRDLNNALMALVSPCAREADLRECSEIIHANA